MLLKLPKNIINLDIELKFLHQKIRQDQISSKAQVKIRSMPIAHFVFT